LSKSIDRSLCPKDDQCAEFVCLHLQEGAHAVPPNKATATVQSAKNPATSRLALLRVCKNDNTPFARSIAAFAIVLSRLLRDFCIAISSGRTPFPHLICHSSNLSLHTTSQTLPSPAPEAYVESASRYRVSRKQRILTLCLHHRVILLTAHRRAAVKEVTEQNKTSNDCADEHCHFLALLAG
jgi:hypothetical protein